MYVTPELTSGTLRVIVGSVTLHVRADDAQVFANLLRQPPNSGLVWLDALDDKRGARLRAVNGGTELAGEHGAGQGEWISWTIAVDIAGEITAGLWQLRVARAG